MCIKIKYIYSTFLYSITKQEHTQVMQCNIVNNYFIIIINNNDVAVQYGVLLF